MCTCPSHSLMCGSLTVFRCYIRMACSLQTNCCRVYLEAAWGKCSHTLFDWRTPAGPNQPKYKFLQSDSHAPKEASLKAPFVDFKSSFSHLTLFVLPFALLPNPLPLSSFILPWILLFFYFFIIFILPFLWNSAHCATRKCESRSCQLHYCAFYLECPKPSVYQWNQPGIQGKQACLSTGAL